MHQEQKFIRMAHILARLKIGEDLHIVDLQKSLQGLEQSEGLKLECGEQTILRDIRELRNLGCPIVYHRSASRQSYELQDKTWELRSTPILSGDELLAVALGAQFAKCFLPKSIGKRVVNVAEDIISANSQNFLCTADMSALKILTPPISGETEEIFATVFTAWQNKQMVTIHYCDEKGNKTERTIEPQALLFHHMTWYIRAFCHLKMGQRTFALVRILSARMIDATFEPRKELYQDATSDNFDSRDAYHDIKIKLNIAGQQYAATHVLHAKQRFQSCPDGSCILSIPEKTRHLAVEWILAQRGNAVPLSPDELVKKVRQQALQIAEQCDT